MRKTLHIATLAAMMLAAPAMAFAQGGGGGGTAPVVGGGADAVPPAGTTGVHKLAPTSDTVHHRASYHRRHHTPTQTGPMATHSSEGPGNSTR